METACHFGRTVLHGQSKHYVAVRLKQIFQSSADFLKLNLPIVFAQRYFSIQFKGHSIVLAKPTSMHRTKKVLIELNVLEDRCRNDFFEVLGVPNKFVVDYLGVPLLLDRSYVKSIRRMWSHQMFFPRV